MNVTVGAAQPHDPAVGPSKGRAAAEAKACIGEIKREYGSEGNFSNGGVRRRRYEAAIGSDRACDGGGMWRFAESDTCGRQRRAAVESYDCVRRRW